MARIPIAPGNASLAIFDIPSAKDAVVSGWLETSDAGQTIDNRRYFAWSPRRKQRLLSLGEDAPDRRWTASALLRHALPEGVNAPWTFDAPDGDADVALVTGSVDADTTAALRAHLEQGGQALIAVADAAPLEALLLELVVRVG